MDFAELGSYLGLPVSTVCDWRVHVKGPLAYRFGGHLKLAVSDLWDRAAKQCEASERRCSDAATTADSTLTPDNLSATINDRSRILGSSKTRRHIDVDDLTDRQLSRNLLSASVRDKDSTDLSCRWQHIGVQHSAELD